MSNEKTIETVDPETGEITIILVSEDPDFADVEAVPYEPQEAVPFNPEIMTLMGDVRDAMLSRIRSNWKPWEVMTKDQQSDLVNAIELQARDVIRGMVRVMTAHEWPHAVVTLGQVTIKGEKGIEAKIECPNIEHNRNVLGDYVGKQVMVMMVDSETFFAHRAEVKLDGAQLELPLGEAEDGEED